MSSNQMSYSRRGFLRLASEGIAGVSSSSWLSALANDTVAAGRRHKSCILLWMGGGPSHIDTFDPKPVAPAEYRGVFSPIATSVPGIQISELFPNFARQMQHAAIIRSMSTTANAHESGRYLMHTGYAQTEPKVDGKAYPDMGAVVAKELGDPQATAPNYVYLSPESGNNPDPLGAGFLGTEYRPLVVQNPSRGVENLNTSLDADTFRNRVALLNHMQEQFHNSHRAEPAQAHRMNIRRAVGLMQSEVARAFDLSQEPAASAAAYGGSRFGQQCLMARRLIEVGIPFVEVFFNGWDHHSLLSTSLRGKCPATDAGMSALVTDLRNRGLLDRTLVVWMGEFGRTPRINRGGDGRDHYAQAWSTVLIGGGLRGGQVIGRTDQHGATVEDRLVSAGDFFATVFKILGIDPAKEHQASGGRPIRIVKEGAQPIAELVG
jgi:hypothetical protein